MMVGMVTRRSILMITVLMMTLREVFSGKMSTTASMPVQVLMTTASTVMTVDVTLIIMLTLMKGRHSCW